MIGQEASERLHAALVERGYLDRDRRVTNALKVALDPKKPGEVEVPEGLGVDAAAVVAMLRERAGRGLAVADADAKRWVRSQRAVIESGAFRELWERVRGRTVYRVDFDLGALVAACVRELKARRGVERARVVWETGEVAVTRGGGGGGGGG